jgi:hypothetical protein
MSALDNLIARVLPDEPVQRVTAFARDLAEGAVHNLWSTKFAVISDRFTAPFWQSYLDFEPGEEIPSTVIWNKNGKTRRRSETYSSHSAIS